MIEIGEKKSGGKLFIVSTPIGNKDDITYRAMSALKICDAVICEERKVGARMLRDINITKDLYELNEQNEDAEAPFLIAKIVSGEKLALISDCGTPLFADPGGFLMKLAIQNDLEIEIVPGVSSIMTALVRSGMSLDAFLYAGFLNRDPVLRIKELEKISQEKRTVVLLETPYRFNQLLEACAHVMSGRHAYIGMNLTMRYETHHYGTFAELHEKFKDERIKAEFVLVFEAAPHSFEPTKKAFGTRKQNRYEPNERSRSDDKPYSRDRDRSQDKPYSRERSYSKDRPYSGEKRSFSDDKPYSRDSGRSQDKPYSKERSYSKDRPYSGEKRSSSDDKPYSRDRDRSQDKPYSKERSYSKDRPYSGEKRSSSGDKPYSRDRDRSQDKPYSKERSYSKDRPYSGEKRSSSEDKPYSRDRDRSQDKPYSEKRSYSGEKRSFGKSSDGGSKWKKSSPGNERGGKFSGSKDRQGGRPGFKKK